jgi:hypothetical protein
MASHSSTVISLLMAMIEPNADTGSDSNAYSPQ